MSLCDWPGRVCAVFFLGGCDLRCPTCHNFHLAWNSDDDPCVSREHALGFLDQRAPWLDGLVVTGGEPALSADLPQWLAGLRNRHKLPVKLDTNGMHPDVVERILGIQAADLVAVDVKGPWSKYPALTGNKITAREAKAALSRIFKLAERHPERFLFRTTQVPLLTPEDLRETRSLLPVGFALHTQPFRHPSRPFQGDHKEQSC
jgi:pyruvate formate lyase activating enzyme